MTTISLLDTEHRSFQHDGYSCISQEAFDIAIACWSDALGASSTDVDSIYDGSEDVVYALAEHLPGEPVRVHIVQFNEEAGGYAVGSLPFFLDIEAAVPDPDERATTRLLVTIEHPAGVPFTATDVRTSIWGAHEYREDVTIKIRENV